MCCLITCDPVNLVNMSEHIQMCLPYFYVEMEIIQRKEIKCVEELILGEKGSMRPHFWHGQDPVRYTIDDKTM